MSAHTCKPGHEGVLADGCLRCREHAEFPMLLDLDQHKMRALWEEMLAVEYQNLLACYATEADAMAGRQLYRLSIWLERYAGLDPRGMLK